MIQPSGFTYVTQVRNQVGLHILTQLPNQVGLQIWLKFFNDRILQFYIIGLNMTFSSNYKYDQIPKGPQERDHISESS